LTIAELFLLRADAVIEWRRPEVRFWHLKRTSERVPGWRLMSSRRPPQTVRCMSWGRYETPTFYIRVTAGGVASWA